MVECVTADDSVLDRNDLTSIPDIRERSPERFADVLGTPDRTKDARHISVQRLSKSSTAPDRRIIQAKLAPMQVVGKLNDVVRVYRSRPPGQFEP